MGSLTGLLDFSINGSGLGPVFSSYCPYSMLQHLPTTKAVMKAPTIPYNSFQLWDPRTIIFIIAKFGGNVYKLQVLLAFENESVLTLAPFLEVMFLNCHWNIVNGILNSIDVPSCIYLREYST